MSLSQADECGEQDLKCFLDPFFEENDLYFHHYAETNVINNSKNCNFLILVPPSQRCSRLEKK